MCVSVCYVKWTLARTIPGRKTSAPAGASGATTRHPFGTRKTSTVQRVHLRYNDSQEIYGKAGYPAWGAFQHPLASTPTATPINKGPKSSWLWRLMELRGILAKLVPACLA